MIWPGGTNCHKSVMLVLYSPVKVLEHRCMEVQHCLLGVPLRNWQPWQSHRSKPIQQIHQMCVSVDVNRCQLMSIDVKWCQMCQWISFALPSPLRFLFWAGPCLLASLTEAPSSRKTTQAKRAMIARSTPGLVNLRVEKTVVWDDMSHACPSLALDRNSVWLWVYARMTDEQVSGWFMMILDNSGCSWCMFWWCSSWESHQGSAGRAIWPFSSTSATSGAMHWKESPRKGKHLSIKDAFRYNDLFWMPTVAKPMAPSAHLYI